MKYASASLVLFIVFFLWVAHAEYILRLFENARFFSHLSDAEREMTYRTEMGLYFSFYKTLISSKTFSDGLMDLLRDNHTEYGHTINTLQRFNLYPEVIVAVAFRVFKSASGYFQWKDQECWSVNRGSGLPPVESCEGIGNYHYFYIYAVFAVAASVLPSMFLSGYLIGDFLGGIFTILAFMSNHGEATRVEWTPPLRESFAYPMFAVQMVILTYKLQHEAVNRTVSIAFILVTVAFCTFWQLSQFIIGLQLGSLLALYSFDFISSSQLTSLWNLFSVSFALSLLLLFGNSMLFNSLFFTSLLSLLVIIRLRPLFIRLFSFRPLFILAHLILYAFGTFGFKLLFHRTFHITADNHVGDLLIAKFANIHTFHTRLYTCAAEFDFMDYEAIQKLFSTWLLPIGALSIFMFFYNFARNEILHGNWKKIGGEPTMAKEHVECLFHLILFCGFAPLALLVMRLKLFSTPQLCLLCSFTMNRGLLSAFVGSNRVTFVRFFLAALLIAGMANQGWANVREQFNIQGEYNNPELENLFEWVDRHTPKDAVFAGTMALMANLKLSTLRPIFNHPHYESEEIRNRTLLAYSIYSRKTIGEVHRSLASRGVQFYVFQPQQCLEAHPRAECTYLAMWDEQDPANRQNPSLCHRIWEGSNRMGKERERSLAPFRHVYGTANYIVLSL